MSRSIFAKLLATENIEIQHGNYPTAYFDVQNRVLGLPIWDDVTKDVYDLLIGHEVGHALYTPEAGWHNSTVNLRVPRSLMNIVEDARIERKIQATYPGLVNVFTRGYKQLFERNFFGTEGREIESYGFVDRLNIKSKLRHLMSVPFSDEEQDLYNAVHAAESFDDAVAAALDIMIFLKEQKKEEPKNDEAEAKSDPTATSGSGHDIEESDEEQDESDDDQNGNVGPSDEGETSEDESETPEDGETSSDEYASDSSESTDTPDDDGDDDYSDEDIMSETDDEFRNNEEELTSADQMSLKQIVEPSKSEIERSIHDPAKNDYQIEDDIVRMAERNFERTGTDKDQFIQDFKQKSTEGLSEFMVSSKKAVNVMVKEFEMRKSAARIARASESKKGSLNTLKLHSYKYNEDIFKRVINLADAKSHGLVMFIDNSGSMYGTMGDVVKQVIQLQMFCRAVSIPFEIYTFTTDSAEMSGPIPPRGSLRSGLKLVKCLDSKQTRTDQKASIERLWSTFVTETVNHPDFRAGATPLVSMLMTAHSIMAKFKSTNKIQKANCIVLSDGEPTSCQVSNGPYEMDRSYSRQVNSISNKGFCIRIGNKKINVANLYTDAVIKLQNNLREEGYPVINFFCAEDTRSAMAYVARRTAYSHELVQTVKYGIRKDSACTIADGKFGGADLTVITQSGSFSGKDDSFELNGDDISKQQMRKQFGKFMGSKKTNRIVFTKFAKLVAEGC